MSEESKIYEVAIPPVGRKYENLTGGKEYRIQEKGLGGLMFLIYDDNGEQLGCLRDGCAHIGFKDWKIEIRGHEGELPSRSNDIYIHELDNPMQAIGVDQEAVVKYGNSVLKNAIIKEKKTTSETVQDLCENFTKKEMAVLALILLKQNLGPGREDRDIDDLHAQLRAAIFNAIKKGFRGGKE